MPNEPEMAKLFNLSMAVIQASGRVNQASGMPGPAMFDTKTAYRQIDGGNPGGLRAAILFDPHVACDKVSTAIHQRDSNHGTQSHERKRACAPP
jgi:hypothetical protein